jgi:2-polyprenyl-3-methyl-5-hydroxy-6-metoxy-1,4-benzoquinol methylase
MSERYHDVPLRITTTDNIYIGGPFTESYYFNRGKAGEKHIGGYTDYTYQLTVPKPGQTKSITELRADDIEAQTGLVSGKDVLVIACALGYLVDELNTRGAIVTGLDISSYAITFAETEFPTLTFTQQDAIATNLKKNDYDLVIGNGIIMCLPDGTVLDLLIEEIYRLLKPTGNFYGLSDLTPQYYYVIESSELITKFENWFGSGVAVITDTGHLPIMADRRIVVG